MKLYLLAVSIFLALPTFAAEELRINTEQGNLSASGSFRLDQYSGNRFSTFDINTTLGYFTWKRVALGLAGSIYNDEDNDTVAILGPVAQYFFWQRDRAATSFSLGYGHGLTDVTISGRLQGRFTFHYFLSESVAFGPFLDFTRVFARWANDYNRVGIGASFGIFL